MAAQTLYLYVGGGQFETRVICGECETELIDGNQRCPCTPAPWIDSMTGKDLPYEVPTEAERTTPKEIK